MIVYHGSKSNFKRFDYGRIRERATSEGVGFYCTNKKDIAERYAECNGYVMHFEFQGKKAISSKKITFTKKNIAKFLKELHKKNEYLSNFGDVEYEGYDKVVDRALSSLFEYSQDDMEILSDICNSCGSFETPLKLLYKMFGYDYCIVDANWGNEGKKQKIYIILNNAAIKHVKSERRGV